MAETILPDCSSFESKVLNEQRFLPTLLIKGSEDDENKLNVSSPDPTKPKMQTSMKQADQLLSLSQIVELTQNKDEKVLETQSEKDLRLFQIMPLQDGLNREPLQHAEEKFTRIRVENIEYN